MVVDAHPHNRNRYEQSTPSETKYTLVPLQCSKYNSKSGYNLYETMPTYANNDKTFRHRCRDYCGKINNDEAIIPKNTNSVTNLAQTITRTNANLIEALPNNTRYSWNSPDTIQNNGK